MWVEAFVRVSPQPSVPLDVWLPQQQRVLSSSPSPPGWRALNTILHLHTWGHIWVSSPAAFTLMRQPGELPED